MMTTQQQPVVSRVGNRAIVWDGATLDELLSQLRQEREQHESEIETKAEESQHSAVMTTAEQIKRDATNTLQKEKAKA